MATQDSSQWLREVFAHSPDGLVMLSPDGTILEANPAFTRLLGQDPGTPVRGKILQDLIAPAQREQWRHDLGKLLDASWTAAECVSLQAGGRRVPLDVRLITRLRHEGRPTAILHLRDASVFYTVERALAASEDQWAQSFDAIADLMCLLDRAGHILRANRALAGRLKTDSGELAGRHYREVFGVLPPAADAGAGDLVAAAPCRIEETAFPGMEGWFSVSVYPLKNGAGALTGAVLIAKDITDARALRDSLRQNETRLRQASKMEAIGRLAGGIAHDFNNLLTSILGFSSLILRALKENDPIRRDLQEVVRAAERATSLTRQLLYFSQEQAPDTKVIQLNAVIESLASFLRRTLGERVRLTLRLQPDLWLIRADISRLEQVLINLAINARDAMSGPGELTLTTSNATLGADACQGHPGLSPGPCVALEVRDTGQGMPPEVLDHLFEPFFTTKGKGRGTGLGLTTVYGIVHQFGGHIVCDSAVNRGTTFRISLPRCLDPGEPGAQPDAGSSLPGGQETVLVVDDAPSIIGTVAQLLKGLGYQVLAAATSAQALKLGETHPGRIDLALIDVVMPDLQGTDLAALLARRRPGLRLLYMSGYTQEPDGNGLRVPPGLHYLKKPFSLQVLARSVRQALDAAPGADPGRDERAPTGGK